MTRKITTILSLLCGLSVNFLGSPAYSQTCSVNSIASGTLVASTPALLLADGNIGTSGNINITCSAGATFTIANIANNGTATSINNVVDGVFATIRDGTTIVAQGNISPTGSANLQGHPVGVAGTALPAPIVNKNYPIDLSIFRNSAQLLPAGTYAYRVTVLLAPQ